MLAAAVDDVCGESRNQEDEARFGCGGSPYLVSRIGDDDTGFEP